MQNPSAPTIILASASPYRRGLLDRFLDQFEAVEPDIDESNSAGRSPGDLASHLARKKAETVATKSRDALVIGADQLTAVCILDPIGRTRYEHTDKTTVHFRDFDRRLAEAYLKLDKPYDCAGSFKIEGAGFVLFESVKTVDPTALIGLPMIWIADRLLELGYISP